MSVREQTRSARPALLSDRIRDALSDAIASGELAPGASLDEQQLADLYGASRTPVREALRQLQASGLIEIAGRRGAVVARISASRIMEMYETMAEIEAICVKLATFRMTPLERWTLMTIHEKSKDAVDSGDVDTYDRLNREFHEALCHATHNEFLAQTAIAMRGRLGAFRREQLRKLARLPQSRAEHDELLQAINEGDAETAARRMRAHMLTAAGALDAYVNEHRDPVDGSGTKRPAEKASAPPRQHDNSVDVDISTPARNG